MHVKKRGGLVKNIGRRKRILGKGLRREKSSNSSGTARAGWRKSIKAKGKGRKIHSVLRAQASRTESAPYVYVISIHLTSSDIGDSLQRVTFKIFSTGPSGPVSQFFTGPNKFYTGPI